MTDLPELTPQPVGYWISGDGVVRVEFKRPSKWERFVSNLFYGDTWHDYEFAA